MRTKFGNGWADHRLDDKFAKVSQVVNQLFQGRHPVLRAIVPRMDQVLTIMLSKGSTRTSRLQAGIGMFAHGKYRCLIGFWQSVLLEAGIRSIIQTQRGGISRFLRPKEIAGVCVEWYSEAKNILPKVTDRERIRLWEMERGHSAGVDTTGSKARGEDVVGGVRWDGTGITLASK